MPEDISRQIDSGKYSLYLQRQPGSNIQNLNITLDFDYNINSYSSSFVNSFNLSGSHLNIEDGFDSDQFLNINF